MTTLKEYWRNWSKYHEHILPIVTPAVRWAVAGVFLAVQAQPAPARELGKPTAELKEALTRVTGVRELRDGRVVVLDKGDLTVRLVDFTTSSITKIGRAGSGPGEYRMPLLIFALPADSTAVFDETNRLGNLIIRPDGKPGGTVSFGAPGTEASRLGYYSAVDSRGRSYRDVDGVRRTGGTDVRNDSMGIERFDRTTGRRDTLTMYSRKIVSPLFKPSAGRSGATGGRARVGGPRPLASFDQWAVAPDGRVAVVSVDPYRVRFVDANGTRHDGPPLPTGHVPVTTALKKQWRAEQQRPVPTLIFSRDGSSVAEMQKPSYTEPESWPAELPPFFPGALLFAPDGTLWVQRTHATDAPPTCDLIDPAGKIAARVVLPKGSRLVGFGTGTVYLVRIDDDDLEYLQRYRMPAFPRVP